MLQHRSGIMGFPLRLLARENYDRIVAVAGTEAVALVTGEERIVPRQASYFICTVEAMPLDLRADFLAVDEVQLAADRERGHVFTDRILHARGRQETWLVGAETIRPLLRRLLPDVAFLGRPRLSTLRYAGPKRIDRLPRRSAVVAFSVADLYAVGERLRRRTGGCALVFGALSPRTRNAQVALYQIGRGGLPRRDRRHRHGVEPRHRPRGVHGPLQVRRPEAAAADPGRGRAGSRAAPAAT
jgi:ATP-dependent RNA helicase SUPV3L1/SUV3